MNAELNEICTKIARIEAERKELAAEISAIKKAAKDKGYDVALITKTVGILMKSGKKQKEAIDQVDLFPTYLNAVGLLHDGATEAGTSGANPPPASAGEAVSVVTAPASPDLSSRVKATVSFGNGPEVDLNDRAAVRQQMGAFIANLAKPAHDPETGELTDHAETVTTSPRADGETLEPGSPSTLSPASTETASPVEGADEQHHRSAAGEQVSSVPPRPLAGSIDMGDIPEALDRRKRQEVAA